MDEITKMMKMRERVIFLKNQYNKYSKKEDFEPVMRDLSAGFVKDLDWALEGDD